MTRILSSAGLAGFAVLLPLAAAFGWCGLESEAFALAGAAYVCLGGAWAVGTLGVRP